MTVKVYHSTDASAPVLSGTVGALIGVLDAILVNGYGAKTAVGWTKAYAGTNLAAYRQSVGSNQFYMRVDDTSATDSRIVGYETMSAISTGTGDFPTNAVQFPGGLYHVKSNGANATARPWFAISNGKMFYFVSSQDGTLYAPMLAFGDITSYKTADAYHTIIIGASTSGVLNARGTTITSSIGTAVAGHYMARSYTQIGSSLTIGKHIDGIQSISSTTAGGNGMPYPHPMDGGLWQSPLWVHEPVTSVLRGELPGVFAPLHQRPLTALDTFTGSGVYAGKTFEAMAVNDGTTIGQLFFETSDTW